MEWKWLKKINFMLASPIKDWKVLLQSSRISVGKQTN
jgi:hypothetical protein